MQVHYGLENIHIVRPVVTIGSFDGVHRGHVKVIERLRQCARQLEGESVIITFDPHPREVLYPLEKRPGILTTREEKIEILSGYGIDHLIILPFTRQLAELSYSDFVEDILVGKLGIKGLVVGYDHRFGKGRAGDFEALKELARNYGFFIGKEEVCVSGDVNVSSTKIRTALELGDIAQVKALLGYDYPICGTVVRGHEIGRKLGFPTANLCVPDPRKLLPACGVYAVKVTFQGKTYEGMLNIGVRPTVSTSGIISLEVNIFGFHQDIYGQELTVALLARIRGERKFSNTAELRRQLTEDRNTAGRLIARSGENEKSIL